MFFSYSTNILDTKHADSGFDGTNVINERTLDYETQKTKNSPHCINSEPKSVPVPLREKNQFHQNIAPIYNTSQKNLRTLSHQRSPSNIIIMRQENVAQSSLIRKINFLSEKIEESIKESEKNLLEKGKQETYVFPDKENLFSSKKKVPLTNTNNNSENNPNKTDFETLINSSRTAKKISQNPYPVSPNLKEKIKKIRKKTGFDMEVIIDDIYSLIS